MLAFSHRLIWLPPQLHCVCDDEAVIIWMFRFLFNIMRCGARGIRTIPRYAWCIALWNRMPPHSRHRSFLLHLDDAPRWFTCAVHFLSLFTYITNERINTRSHINHGCFTSSFEHFVSTRLQQPKVSTGPCVTSNLTRASLLKRFIHTNYGLQIKGDFFFVEDVSGHLERYGSLMSLLSLLQIGKLGRISELCELTYTYSAR